MPDDAAMDADERGAAADHATRGEAVDLEQEATRAAHPAIDLDGIEADLADVEVALARLDSGEYWRDEVTGADLPDTLLAERPTARRTTA